MIAPALFVWWLRPVSRATRVGEQSAVVWKRLYLSPWLASRSSVGMGIGAAERARVAEADVVDQEDDDVGRALWAPSPRTAAAPWHRARRARWRADSRAPRWGATVRSISPDTVGGDVAVVCLNPSKAITAANMRAALNVARMTCFLMMLSSLVMPRLWRRLLQEFEDLVLSGFHQLRCCHGHQVAIAIGLRAIAW